MEQDFSLKQSLCRALLRDWEPVERELSRTLWRITELMNIYDREHLWIQDTRMVVFAFYTNNLSTGIITVISVVEEL